ncbi:Multidrug resistance protein MdtE [Ensifer sp. M14]|jgi:RND family efflux transporter MFP subunit|uniref:efflux RND transporter periplasmic adaptor subunit n=1 Tax=Sinorhizobium/Ensifer group TaxID=227292 RepID=UPI00098790C7|nr:MULTISPECIES: efflux RND transporter periplasmic adaptor subunit [Sinorhizobium/Ensifer group]OOG66875.1 efflux transporter periplasmic adaptor subunit [Sinorhizobium sp. A49]RDL52397.1 Multidrug resistance protein MdtE [Ensifer sp. M14]
MKIRPAASRSRAAFGVSAAVLAAFFVVGCQGEDDVGERPPRPVRTVAVSFNPEDTYGSLVGEIRPRTETSFSFRQGGEIRERDVEVGDLVDVGAVLARLDAEDAQDAVRKAEANLFSAEAQFQNAEADRARQQQLYPRTTTRQVLEAATARASMAQAGVDAAKAGVRIAQTNLDNRILKANAAGVVTAVGGEVGQVVGGGQMVVRVAQLGTRDAVFQVPEATIQSTGGDARVNVQLLSNPNIKATGTVREISPTADPITRNFTVRVGLDTAPDEFRFGSAVRGSMRLSGEPAARLPISALFSEGNQSAVWIVDDASNTTKLVPVEVHRFDTKDFLVTKGLSSGDNVVVAGVQQLRPGMPVRLLEGSAE